MGNLYIVELTKNYYLENKELINCVSEERKNKIKSFKFTEDSNRALIAALISRYAVIKETGLKNDELVFDKNDYGKPFLSNITNENTYFNLSHSGNYVVCLIDKNECGVDVEKQHERYIDIASSSFHEEDVKEINKCVNKEEKIKMFFKIWTIKEAYLKKLGVGLSKNMNSFYVRFNDNIQVIDFEGESKKHNIYTLETRDKYSISCISDNKVKVHYMDDKKLKNYFKKIL